MYTITVLMSTYNGEQYIAEQIETILKQINVAVKLIIRDDGSKDGTLKILEKYRDTYHNIQLIYGENIGWRKSFSALIKEAGKDSYYAFSDQDDSWMPDKLITAIEMMQPYNSVPCVYRGRSFIADGMLNQTGKVFPNGPVISLTRSLFQNYCQGCNLVFNDKVRDLYLRYPIDVSSQDVWLPLIARHAGVIVDDPNPHMLYRVHSKNASAGKSTIGLLRKWFKVIRKKSDSLYHYNYGEVLYNHYSDVITEDSYKICKQMAEYRFSAKAKLSLLFNKEVRGNSFPRTLLVKYFVLTNGYRSDI